jgi:transposase
MVSKPCLICQNFRYPQAIHLRRLYVYLQRRANAITCPRCQACCWHVQESHSRCLRDLPILERPIALWLPLRRFACPDCHHRPWEKSETFGVHVKWTKHLYQHVRQDYLHGRPCCQLSRRYDLSERTVFRWTFKRSRGGRPRKLGRVIGIDEYSRRK